MILHESIKMFSILNYIKECRINYKRASGYNISLMNKSQGRFLVNKERISCESNTSVTRNSIYFNIAL